MITKEEHRFRPIVAAVAMQLCIGVVYIWSIFQTGVANALFDGNNAMAGLTYSIALLALSIGSIIGGKLSAKISVQKVVMIGGFLLSLGFFLSSFVTKEFPYLIWVTFGLLAGGGMGFCYTPSIGCAQKWVPHKKGLVTGIIVASLGISGLISTPIARYLIDKFGGPNVGEFKTFMVFGIVFFVICTISSIFIKNPSEEFTKKYSTTTTNQAVDSKSYPPKEVLVKPIFYVMTFAFMLACMSGLMLIGFAMPIAVAKGLSSTAVLGVLLISVFNATGRLVWGTLSDRLGRINVIVGLLIVSATMSALLSIAEGYFIYALIACIGLCYGGFLSVFPSLTADLFGPKFFATNYGMAMAGWGIIAVTSSFIAGYYKDIAKDDISLMSPAFFIAAGSAIVAILLIVILKKMQVKH